MIIVILIITGLCFGSFINALVWRLHEQSKSTRKDKKLFITNGRSICPNCRHQLSALDLIPVISWIILAGKCHYCKKPISFQYPLIELITPVLFIFSYIYWPYSYNNFGKVLFVNWLALLVILIALTIYDFRWKLLPDKLVLTTLILSLSLTVIRLFLSSPHSSYLYSELSAVAVISGLFYGLFYLSGGKWIGGGDVKLSVSLGLIVGSVGQSILLIFLASLVGTILVLPMLVKKSLQPKSQIPFGPLLITATFICFFYGSQITHWYQNLVIH